jgi:carnosine N-methyltransferase
MQAAFQTVVNDLLVKRQSLTIFPLLQAPFRDEIDTANRIQEMRIPDADSWYLVEGRSRLSSQIGDFVEVYAHSWRRATCDVVVTCFFVDTAADIFEFIAVISHVLKRGGVWINAGPLHYHQNSTLRYSFAALTEVLDRGGFRIVHKELAITSYTGEEAHTLKPEMYNVGHFVAILEDTSKVFSVQQTSDLRARLRNSTDVSIPGWPNVNFVLR